MAESLSHERSFSAIEQDDVLQYRRLSLLAVAALVLGVCSPLALVHPLLWAVPLAAVVTAAAALRSLSANEESLSGRWAAILGLVLALLFGGWAVGASVTRQWVLEWQSRRAARQWLDLVREGRLHEAHQITLAPQARLGGGAPLETTYRNNEDLQERYDFFFNREPMRAIAEFADQGRFEFEGAPSVSDDGETTIIVRRVRLHYARGGEERVLPFDLVLERRPAPSADAAIWTVANVRRPGA